jgi:hypothetical protein
MFPIPANLSSAITGIMPAPSGKIEKTVLGDGLEIKARFNDDAPDRKIYHRSWAWLLGCRAATEANRNT